jgi:ketosteroid isomerase-like protein
MSESKEIVRKFFDTMCSGDFEGGFAGMTVDATWSVIGTTGVSGTLDKAGMLSKQLPMLASFKEPPVIGIDEMIAEGDRVVVLAHCKGVGPTGPYEQKRYSFVVRVRGGLVAEVVEYLDTVAVETGICGNKIAPRNAGRLAGKVAIITGGSGIGCAARSFPRSSSSWIRPCSKPQYSAGSSLPHEGPLLEEGFDRLDL